MNDKATKVRKGEELNSHKLAIYLQEHLGNLSGNLSIEQFPGGFSNLTYLLKMGASEMVLRRPPFGANIKSAHDMGREFTILSKLFPVYSKVPKPLLYCEDESLLGSPFYVMQRVEGVILRSKMPKEMIPDAKTMKGVSNAFMDTFAELHKVDYQQADLSDFGRPEGYVQRQVSGWTKRYFKAKTDEVADIEATALWLAQNIPTSSKTALIHNDFKYDNLILDSNDWTKVLAVLDWEMSTIGDPLMDLGTMLSYWVNPNDPPFMQQLNLSPTTIPGNPARGELIEMYAQKSGNDIQNVTFYYIFGLFKLAVIIQQIYTRYKKGHTKDERFVKLIDGVFGCGMITKQVIQKGRVDDLF